MTGCRSKTRRRSSAIIRGLRYSLKTALMTDSAGEIDFQVSSTAFGTPVTRRHGRNQINNGGDGVITGRRCDSLDPERALEMRRTEPVRRSRNHHPIPYFCQHGVANSLARFYIEMAPGIRRRSKIPSTQLDGTDAVAVEWQRSSRGMKSFKCAMAGSPIPRPLLPQRNHRRIFARQHGELDSRYNSSWLLTQSRPAQGNDIASTTTFLDLRRGT